MKNDLFTAIRKLYISKIPPLPRNAPKLPPLPEDKSLQTMTKIGAPKAPENMIQPPKLDPAIIKRNSILVPRPNDIPGV